MSARLAAARALVALERGQTTLAAEVDRDRQGLRDARDRALFLEITSGVLRWRAELDACLELQSRRRPDELTPEVRSVLRAGAYQLLHLDRVPAHAVVSESVDVTRRLRQERAAGFVNAVLRGLQRDANIRSKLPARPADASNEEAALAYLSVTLSHPRWLVARWLNRVGLEAAIAWCEFNNTPPEITVRPVPGVTAEEIAGELTDGGFAVRPARYVPNALRLPAGAYGRLTSGVQQRLVVQDEGSQLVAWATGTKAGARVLDVCAAPGGKTLVLNQLAGPSGLVVAADVRPARMRLLKSRLLAHGVSLRLVALDARTALPFGPTFDEVLLDAPCSGLGTLRRDPDVKWKRTADELTSFASTQTLMLDAAASAVRPGGALTYATCSSEPEENDSVVDRFLQEHPGFHEEAVHLPEQVADRDTLVGARGRLRTLPFRHELDAYFAARLVHSAGA